MGKSCVDHTVINDSDLDLHVKSPPKCQLMYLKALCTGIPWWALPLQGAQIGSLILGNKILKGQNRFFKIYFHFRLCWVFVAAWVFL